MGDIILLAGLLGYNIGDILKLSGQQLIVIDVYPKRIELERYNKKMTIKDASPHAPHYHNNTAPRSIKPGFKKGR